MGRRTAPAGERMGRSSLQIGGVDRITSYNVCYTKLLRLLEEELLGQEIEAKKEEECLDYGDLDDYTEIFGEMEDLTGGL